MDNILVVGLGQIGLAVFEMLEKKYGFNVHGFDNSDSKEHVYKVIENVKPRAIVVCTPASENIEIARYCKIFNIAYFDLTESLEVRDAVKDLAKGSETPFFSQCGLAPGIVNVIACDLVKEKEKVRSVSIFVGANPIDPQNSMKYHLTWNTEGLVNEYINDAEIISEGKIKSYPALGFREYRSFRGCNLEGALTSGGLGSIAPWLVEQGVEYASYKTLRHEGHWDYIEFLKSDLGFDQTNKELWVDMFNKFIPRGGLDFVAISIEADELGYTKIINGTERYSAIQVATASGVCALVDLYMQLYMQGKLQYKGFVTHDMLSMVDIFESDYAKVYEE